MTISRSNEAGWGYAEVLTSAQLNEMDEHLAAALDKRAGQSDTLSSAITVDDTASILLDDGSELTAASGSVTTVESGASLTVAAGATVSIASSVTRSGAETITTGGALTADAGSTVTLNGTTTIASPAISGGTIDAATWTGGSVTTPVGVISDLTATLAEIGTLDVTGNVTVAGDLTVGGVTSAGGSSSGSAISGATIRTSNIATTSFTGGTVVGAAVSGGTVNATTITNSVISGGTLTLNGFPSFSPAKTITRSINLMTCMGSNSGGTTGSITRAVTAGFAAPTTGGVVLTNGEIVFTTASASNLSVGVMIPIDASLIHGATLTTLAYSVQRASTDGSAPNHPIAACMMRRLVTNNTMESLFSYGGSGFFVEDTYGQSTTQHTVVLSTDQNNIIDKGSYNYYIQFWNEMGDVHVQSGLKIYGAQVAMGSIVSLQYA